MGADDLARGLVAHLNDPSALRDRASRVVGGTLPGSEDLDLENHPDGDLLLNALWDASFEGGISDEAIDVAKQLAHRSD